MTSEAGRVSVPPQQAQPETQWDTSVQDSHLTKTLPLNQVCTCVTCLDHGNWVNRQNYLEMTSWTPGCRVTGCQWTVKDDAMVDSNDLLERKESYFWHEISPYHYGKPGDWRCREAGCRFVTKRFGDLKRHYSSKHCIKPQNLQCPILDCRYHQIGFTRKDKLKSHYQNAHKGRLLPGKPNQAIKPKLGGSA